MNGFLYKNPTARAKGRSPLLREKVSREQKKVEGSSTFFIRYVNFDQWNCFIFQPTNDLTKNVFAHVVRKW